MTSLISGCYWIVAAVNHVMNCNSSHGVWSQKYMVSMLTLLALWWYREKLHDCNEGKVWHACIIHVRNARMRKPGTRLIVSSDIGKCLKHEPAGLTADWRSLDVYWMCTHCFQRILVEHSQADRALIPEFMCIGVWGQVNWCFSSQDSVQVTRETVHIRYGVVLTPADKIIVLQYLL